MQDILYGPKRINCSGEPLNWQNFKQDFKRILYKLITNFMNSKNVRNEFKLKQIARIREYIVCNIISNKCWKLLCFSFMLYILCEAVRSNIFSNCWFKPTIIFILWRFGSRRTTCLYCSVQLKQSYNFFWTTKLNQMFVKLSSYWNLKGKGIQSEHAQYNFFLKT